MPILDVSAQVSGLPLGYMNYDQISANAGQFVTDIFWDVDFKEPAPAVYFPGNDFLRCRTKSVNCNPEDGEITPLRAEIRGFVYTQGVGTGNHGGTVTMELQDFDDQSLVTWMWDWYCKIRDPKTNYMFGPNDTKAALVVITQYNNQRIPIKRYTCRGMYPTSVGEWKDFNGVSGDASDKGAFTANFQVDNMTVELLTNVQ